MISLAEWVLIPILVLSAAVPVLGANPVCGAFSGGFSAGSVSVAEVLERASSPKSFNARELAPIDSERPAKVEVAQFGLG